MSNYKDPQDKTAAYLSRDGKWFKMDKESVRKVCGRPRLRNTAKIAFFGLQPHFHDGDGLLLTPLEHVAQELGATRDKLSEDIDILVEVGILRWTQTGLLYDPVSYKLITKKEEPADAKFCRISQDSAEFSENLHSPLGQNAALDKIRASSLDASNAASKERSDSLSIKNEEDRKKDEGSLGVASLFPSLTIEVIEEVRVANTTLDWSDVCSLFINKNKKTHPSRINRKWFETFVAGYAKRQGVATASPGPASKEDEEIRIAHLPKLEVTVKWVKDEFTGKDKEIDIWTIGGKTIEKWGIDQADFLRLCQKMTPRSEADAVRYLHKLIGKEWNAKHALKEFGNEYLFNDWPEKEVWYGSEYEWPEEKEGEKAA